MSLPDDRRGPSAATWVVLVIACAGQFMVVLDVSVVNVALPAMRVSLGFDPTGLQWVVNAYALTFAGFLLLGGRIADLFGRKRIFVLGLALFSLSSLVGGLAHTAGMLIAARAVQGIGAAVLAPATLTILTTSFTGPARARALGTWTAMGAAGGATGGLIGGVLTEYLSWRWILLINVPIGVLVIVLAAVFLTEGRRDAQREQVDLLGAVLVTGGLAAITYGIVRTQLAGWSDPAALLPLLLGIAALGVFVLVEGRFAAAPLMPLRLFAARVVWVGNVLMVLIGSAFITMWYFLTLYMQNVLHYTAVETGLGFLPHSLTIIAGARLAPRLLPRFGARPVIVAGALIGAAGFLWQSGITPDSSYPTGILGPGILMCAGLGLLMTPVTTTITSGAGPSDAGLVSGLLNAARQVGGSLGLAVLATIAGRVAQTPAALTLGYRHAFAASAVILLAIVVLTAALPAGRRP
ncbi:MAG TPA: MFS transporter, partial [Pseudonocardiaceae bacterium]|nr:MFS transporter [Pseudonocardiaceae bacterium]